MKKPHFTIQFICVSLVFAAIMLQSFTNMVKMKPLEGFDREEYPVDLSFKTYYDGSYQDYLTEHAKRNTGFREFFIRNYNQVAYSCFGKITNNNIVKGADHELYLKMYLNDLTGATLKLYYADIEEAKAAARKNVEETLRLIDTLHAHHTDFLFVFAPTKTAVYPEKMPQSYQEQISDFSLEEYYIELFKENNIPHIDFLSYFKSWKHTAEYPLYTCTGTHWAASTLPFVTDSIMKKIAVLTGKDLPRLRCLDAPLTTDYTEQDGELEKNMNLLFPLSKPALPRPITALDDTVNKARINLLVVGDSHAGIILSSCFSDAFANWDFWEYNKTVISSNPDYNYVNLNQYFDAYKVLQNTDVVIAVFTSPMLYDYMFGFTDTVFGLYETLRCDSCMLEIQIEKYKWIIQHNAEWYDTVVKQANEKGITLEEALRDNAKYVVFMENQHEHEE